MESTDHNAPTRLNGMILMDELEQIGSVEAWDSGGGVALDLIRLKDGRILAISDESVVLYADEEDLVEGEPKVRQTLSLL